MGLHWGPPTGQHAPHMRRALAPLLAVGLCACQAPPAQTPSPSSAAEEATDDAPASGTVAPDDASSQANGDSRAESHPLEDNRAPDPAHALPRLGIKQIGLHVGGGTGSAEERKALLDALAAGERGVLECYRLVDKAGAGGTFGVDLYVGAKGGHPEVRGVRHKLGGEEFEACMKGALARTTFGPQARPLVVSYSLRFELSP
jgi:hypothetical protein